MLILFLLLIISEMSPSWVLFELSCDIFKQKRFYKSEFCNFDVLLPTTERIFLLILSFGFKVI